MNTKKTTAFAASIAVAAAIALIVASTYSGFPITTTIGSSVGQGQTSTGSSLAQTSQTSSQQSSAAQSSTQQSSTQQASSQQTSSQQSSSQQSSSQQSSSQQSSTQQSSSQQAQGTFAVLLTDPPTVPVGVTKVYVSYVDLAVHVSGMDNNSGWTILKTSGTIELMGTVNVSQDNLLGEDKLSWLQPAPLRHHQRGGDLLRPELLRLRADQRAHRANRERSHGQLLLALPRR